MELVGELEGAGPLLRQYLIARRLVERGVRFAQIYHGGGRQQQTWDAHGSVEEHLAIHCPEIDVPIAGLLTDLERRGLLTETLVVWGGEFGRMPTTQGAVEFQVAGSQGRDHDPKGFTVWLAGAGIKPGSHCETDDLGAEAAVDPHPLRDLHATILHLMGIDHERLTYPLRRALPSPDRRAGRRADPCDPGLRPGPETAPALCTGAPARS